MTQPPTNGRSAPTSTDFGSVPADAGHHADVDASRFAGAGVTDPRRGSAATGPVGVGAGDWSRDSSADAPTTTLPVPQWNSPPPAAGQGIGTGVAPMQPAGAPANGQPAFSSTPLTRPPGSGTPLVQGTAGSGPTPPPMLAPPGAGAHGATTRGVRSPRSRGPRRARLQLRHIDPWTVLKFSCVLAIALFFVWLIVIGVLYGVLDGAGIIGKINDTVTTLQSGDAKPPITAKIVFGGAAIIGVVNIVLFIALSTVGAVVYNLCADLVGGIEITLSER